MVAVARAALLQSACVGVTGLGSQGYTVLQMMQIIGDQKVRVVPDVSVSGAQGGAGLTEALLGMLLKGQTNGSATSGEPLKK